MSLTEKKVTSLSGYVEVVAAMVAQWSDTAQGEVRPWYRGQSRAEWGLIPGEYRVPDVNADEIRSEFQLKARPLLREAQQTEWEWYFLMQHHGLPTRLLDWTTGALLGLYFALREGVGEYDAAIWILDPWALNQAHLGKPELLLCSEPKAQAYLPRLFSRRPGLPEYPIAIVPPYNSDRITVQRGTFTVHGSERRGLEDLFESRFAKVVVPKGSALKIKRGLRGGGIGEFTVFPDLDGLCREIRAVEIEGC
jgi:hypothetical protein